MSQMQFGPSGLTAGVVTTSSNVKTKICEVDIPTGAHSTLTAIVDGRIIATGLGASVQRVAAVSNASGTPVIDAVTALLGGVLAPVLSPLMGASVTIESAGAGKIGLFVLPGTTTPTEWAGCLTGIIN